MNAPIDLQHIQGTCASECHCNACILCYNAHILTPRLLDPYLFAQWSHEDTCPPSGPRSRSPSAVANHVVLWLVLCHFLKPGADLTTQSRSSSKSINSHQDLLVSLIRYTR